MSDRLKASLTHFLDVVTGDIDALQALADKVADEEKSHLTNVIGLGHMTTLPLGATPPRQKLVGTKSRCTVPLAMTCFSVLDFIGQLLSKVEKEKYKSTPTGKQDNRKRGHSDTSSKDMDGFILHTRVFLRELTAKGSSLLNDVNAEILQDAYRHSIAHAFLPSTKTRYGYCIAYTDVFDPYYLFHHLDYFGEEFPSGALVLNVVCLTRLVKEGMRKFANLLDAEEGKDILRQYERFLEENSERL